MVAANLGFLWKELPFLERITRAKAAGFNAVEFHDDAQSVDVEALQSVMVETRLPVLSLNTRMGETSGCAAIVTQADQARKDIDDAVRVAKAINAKAIHVVAGKSDGEEARDAFISSLFYATANYDGTILIEPISRTAIPGYFLYSLYQARDIADTLNNPRIKMMFDLFHVRTLGYNVLEVAQEFLPFIGHIQFSGWPNRDEPELAASLIGLLKTLGYEGDFGAEYRPNASVESGLSWLKPALLAAD
ncbi:MAG: TIM barrel protein [Notoacmeibacter sp.]